MRIHLVPRGLLLGLALLACDSIGATGRTLPREVLIEKISGFWIGQLVGNYLGFPFELVYVDEPLPVLVDRYYTPLEDAGLRMNRADHRAFVPFMLTAFDGAYSDDDTDIEFVTLHAVEQHGLDLTYPQIAEAWKRHINRRIWVANRTARDLMDTGLLPPDTGAKANNPHWFQIDPQLVNEIWSAFYPGMPAHAARRAEWGARMTSDDWGVHPTIAYAVMISEAFFENRPSSLVHAALAAIPPDSPFHEGLQDVIRWHAESPADWRSTRRKIHDKYFRYQRGDYQAPVSVFSSLVNGLCGVMAVLHGDGDFMKTVGIAVSAGYDCDNQAATCGGLMGVMLGARAIPDALTREAAPGLRWEKPFNDTYINYSRDGLPIHNRISDLVERIARIAESAILQEGGRKVERNGRIVYHLPTPP
ncbi:MAG: ADP-ribosylglycohydrolase family protein [Verrucomicrobiae bacterium]|nr:ADP-ribosylglycohydrolase family protein [Verrucomicrobiae bacterium]